MSLYDKETISLEEWANDIIAREKTELQKAERLIYEWEQRIGKKESIVNQDIIDEEIVVAQRGYNVEVLEYDNEKKKKTYNKMINDVRKACEKEYERLFIALDYPENFLFVITHNLHFNYGFTLDLSEDQRAGLEYVISLMTDEMQQLIQLQYIEKMTDIDVLAKYGWTKDKLHRRNYKIDRFVSKNRKYIALGLDGYKQKEWIKDILSVKNYKEMSDEEKDIFMNYSIDVIPGISKYSKRLYLSNMSVKEVLAYIKSDDWKKATKSESLENNVRRLYNALQNKGLDLEINDFIEPFMEKTLDKYDEVSRTLLELKSEIVEEGTVYTHLINLIEQCLKRITWYGIYHISDHGFVLGAYHGKIAKSFLPYDTEIMSNAVKNDETQFIPSVVNYAGKVECMEGTSTEIILPIHKNDKIICLLKVDSVQKNRFSIYDVEGFQRVIATVEEVINQMES